MGTRPHSDEKDDEVAERLILLFIIRFNPILDERLERLFAADYGVWGNESDEDEAVTRSTAWKWERARDK